MNKLLLLLLFISFQQTISAQDYEKAKEPFYHYSFGPTIGMIHYEGNSEAWRKFSMHWRSKNQANPYFQDGLTIEKYDSTTKAMFSQEELKTIYEIQKRTKDYLYIRAIITKKGKQYSYKLPEKFSGNDTLRKYLNRLRRYVKKEAKIDFREFKLHKKDQIICDYEINVHKSFNTKSYMRALENHPLSEIDPKILKQDPFKSSDLYWIGENIYSKHHNDSNHIPFTVKGLPNSDFFIEFEKPYYFLRGEETGDSYTFKQIPKGKELTIISICYTSPIKVAVVKVNSNTKEVVFTNYDIKTIQEMQDRMWEKLIQLKPDLLHSSILINHICRSGNECFI